MERVSDVGLLDFKDLSHSMYCTQLARAFGLSIEQVREEHLRSFTTLGVKQLTLKDLDQLGVHPAGHLTLRTRDQQGRAFFRVVKDARGVLNYSERDEHSRAVGQPRWQPCFRLAVMNLASLTMLGCSFILE